MFIIYLRTVLVSLFLALFMFQMTAWGDYMSAVGMSCLFTAIILGVWRNGNATFSWSLSALFAVLTILYCVLSVEWSVVAYNTLAGMPTMLLLPLILLSSACGRGDWISFEVFYKVFSAMCVVVAIYCATRVYQFGLLSPELHLPFANPNSAAGFLGCAAVLCFVHGMIGKAMWSRVLALGILFTLMTVVLALGNRSIPILFVVVSLVLGLVIVWMKNGAEWRRAMVSVIASLVVVGLCFPVAAALVKDFPLYETFEGIASGGLSPRFLVWESTINAIQSHNIVFGNGLGTFRVIYPGYRLPFDNTAGFHAHNDILHLWFEMGLVGLSIAAILVFTTLRGMVVAIQSRKTDLLYPISVIVFLVMFSQLSSVIVSPTHMVVLAICLVRLLKETEPFKGVNFSVIGRVALSVIAVMVLGLSLLTTYEQNRVGTLQASARNIPMMGYLMELQNLKPLMFRTNPALPILDTAASLQLLQNYDFTGAAGKKMRDDLMGLLDEAETLNPYNPYVPYLRKRLLDLAMEEGGPVTLYQDALTLNPMFLPARIALFKATEDPAEAYDILKAGLPYQYFSGEPEAYYDLLAQEALKRDDQETLRAVEIRQGR